MLYPLKFCAYMIALWRPVALGLPPPRPATSDRDWAHPTHICSGTGLTPAHICSGTGLTPAHIGAGFWPLTAHICAGTGPTPAHIDAGTGLVAWIGVPQAFS